jgi:hypothetical protein
MAALPVPYDKEMPAPLFAAIKLPIIWIPVSDVEEMTALSEQVNAGFPAIIFP